MEISECIARLTGKDAKDACAWAEQIAAQRRNSDCWAPYPAQFAALLRHKILWCAAGLSAFSPPM